MAATDDVADLAPDERAALEALLFRMADDEFVLAERYTEWQVRAPTLESDLALANIAQDELGHARLWYDALQGLGYSEPELVWERNPADFRHSILVELPFTGGDWADPIVRSYLYDEAEHLRLQALEDAPVRALADPIGKVQREEEYHREHAQSWLERLCDDAEGREAVEAAVGRLFGPALTLFVPGEHEATVERMGLRSESLADQREQWLDVVVPFLGSLGVEVPFGPEEDVDDLLPERVGRDGNHTDDWPALHEELTRTYRELGRSDARRLRGERRE
ncbi:1,2-phenylacetyl-CoA epoxidase subunit PaaC [Haloarculaceae archaeon H-GB2-1]|nr:phenylacetate-CoA oxygenase subunit PaaC [Haloarculaceae archaeon H-GB1-1]MEA5386036.1 1,2-phenylacetyl-CoA epoxidase subunit PaaC [Haloarculaceae archaeon H-GB11]MEA5407541.1 1,2-phenylacetyl-CoA epoxidase subunit PaaC [Haloarculaceae archaeon H-GB2-1]